MLAMADSRAQTIVEAKANMTEVGHNNAKAFANQAGLGRMR